MSETAQMPPWLDTITAGWTPLQVRARAAARYAARIAYALNRDTWRLAPPDTRADSRSYATLWGPGWQALDLWTVGSSSDVRHDPDALPTQLLVVGNYRRLPYTGYPYSGGAGEDYDHLYFAPTDPTLKISTRWTPLTVAQKITAEVLPGYRSALVAQRRAAQRRRWRQWAKRHMVDKLLAAHPRIRLSEVGARSDDEPYWRKGLWIDGGNARVTISEEAGRPLVTTTLEHMPPPVALATLRAFAQSTEAWAQAHGEHPKTGIWTGPRLDRMTVEQKEQLIALIERRR